MLALQADKLKVTFGLFFGNMQVTKSATFTIYKSMFQGTIFRKDLLTFASVGYQVSVSNKPKF